MIEIQKNMIHTTDSSIKNEIDTITKKHRTIIKRLIRKIKATGGLINVCIYPEEVDVVINNAIKEFEGFINNIYKNNENKDFMRVCFLKKIDILELEKGKNNYDYILRVYNICLDDINKEIET